MDCLYLVTPRVSPGGGGGGGDITDITGSLGIVVTNGGGPIADVAFPLATVEGQLLEWDAASGEFVVSDANLPAAGEVPVWSGTTWSPGPATPGGAAGGDLAATAIDPVSNYPNPIVSGLTHAFSDLEFNQPGDAAITHNTVGARIFSLDKWTFGRATPVQTDQVVSIDAPDRFALSITGPHADAGASIQMQTHTAGVVDTEWEVMATGAGASQGAGKWNIRWIPLGVAGDYLTIVGTSGFIGMGVNVSPGERLDVLGNVRATEFRGPAATDLILRCQAAGAIRFSDLTPLDMASLFEGGGQVRLELAAGRAAMSWFADDLNQSLIVRSGTGTGATFLDHQTMNLRDQAGTQRYAWSTGTSMAQTTDGTVTLVTIGPAPHTFNCNVTVLGNTVLGDASGDTWSTVARLASTITPSADNNFDLGTTALRFSNVHARLLNARADATDTLKAVYSATAITQTAGNSYAISARDTQIQGQFRFTREVVAPGATITYNWDLGNYKQTTLGGAANAIAFSNLRDGGIYMIELIQDATANRTVTWPATAIFPMGDAADPPLSQTSGARDRFLGICDGTNIYFFPVSIQEGTSRAQVMPINTGAAGVTGGTTVFLMGTTISATETDVQGLCSSYAKARRLRVVVLTNSLTGTCTVTIRKNNADSGVSLTVTAATTGVFSDFTNRVEFSEGDNFSIEITANGVGNITFYGSWEYTAG